MVAVPPGGIGRVYLATAENDADGAALAAQVDCRRRLELWLRWNGERIRTLLSHIRVESVRGEAVVVRAAVDGDCPAHDVDGLAIRLLGAI